MIVKISPRRGTDPGGLLGYLFGPGRHNEHTDPHLVAAALGLAEPGWRPSGRRDVTLLAVDLDYPRRCHDRAVSGGHIWHCSLSLPDSDGVLTDNTWGDIARAVIVTMRFDDTAGVAPCRWVAVHHGRSRGGNDHIHIVVDLVREDGSVVSIWRDRVKLSRLAAELERTYGLSVVTGRGGAGLPGVTRAEWEVAARAGRAEPDRARLARIVRAAAVASMNEGLFVQRLRSHPAVLVRPRYTEGGREHVVGYAVALQLGRGRAPVWFGGGRLARDLTLPRLREYWADGDEARRAALADWIAPPMRLGQFDEIAWTEAAERIGLAVERLATIPVDDRAGWAGAAREAAGIYAALAARLEGKHSGPLSRAADVLAHSAQTRAREPHARRDRAVRDLRGAAMTALQAGPFGHTVWGQIAFHKQLILLTRAIERAHRARSEADAAARLEEVAREQLVELAASRARVSQAAPVPALPPGRSGPCAFPAARRPPVRRVGPDLGR